MQFIMTPSTVLSPGVLDVRKIPRRFLSIGRSVYPREVLSTLFWRAVIERPSTRYILFLLPFVLIIVLRPGYALAMSQAPLLMLGVILLVEHYVLSVPSLEARKRLIDPADADQAMDLLGLRAREVLTRIATGRDIAAGELHLVIEQSGLMRIPPLTYLSIQREGEGFLDLDSAEREMLSEALFDTDLDERLLQRINVRDDKMDRVFTLDTTTISAHARLAAMALRTPA